MVQGFGVGPGSLATDLAVAVEPPPGIGASVGTNTAAHHRIRSRSPRPERPDRHVSGLIRSSFWVCSTRYGYPPRKAGRFTGSDFLLQPDETLRSPAGSALTAPDPPRQLDPILRV